VSPSVFRLYTVVEICKIYRDTPEGLHESMAGYIDVAEESYNYVNLATFAANIVSEVQPASVQSVSPRVTWLTVGELVSYSGLVTGTGNILILG